MFFIETLGECAWDAAASPKAAEIAVEVTFEGEPPGTLTMRLTASAARQIAADFLGAEEEEVSASRVNDVVCELANMICGSVLSRVEGASVFNLAAPRIVPFPESRAAGPGTIRYIAALSNGELAINITIGTPT
jgi:CheY-specific phosphatase CheX